MINMVLLDTLYFMLLFLFIFSCLYVLKIAFEIVIVYLSKSGKVDLGKYGFLFIGLAISYIITYLIEI